MCLLGMERTLPKPSITPAQFTRTSNCPHFPTMSFTSFSMSGSEDTSHLKFVREPESESGCGTTSTEATFAPWSRNLATMAAPMPLEPPVTMQT